MSAKREGAWNELEVRAGNDGNEKNKSFPTLPILNYPHCAVRACERLGTRQEVHMCH